MKTAAYILGILFSVSIGLLSFKSSSHEVPNIYPIQEMDVEIGSSYGMRIHPFTKEKKMHEGVDFIAKLGTPVVATADGKVIEVAFLSEGYGNKITIQHANKVTTIYAQLDKVKVTEGQLVSQMDVIGTVGSSGRSTTPHLHYEIELDKVNVDPLTYITN